MKPHSSKMRNIYSVLTLCLPLLLVFKISASSLHVVPGSTLVLPCLPFPKSSSGANITWRYNSARVLAATAGSLRISPVGFSSQGEYECVLVENNIEWRNKYSVKIDISSNFALKLNEGLNVVLPCVRPQTAKAENYAFWFKETAGGQRKGLIPAENSDAAKLKLSGRLEWVYSDPRDNDQSVELHEATMEDAGLYHCESEEGERFSSIELMVEAAPMVELNYCKGFTAPWEVCKDEDSRSWEAILGESLTEFSMKVYNLLMQSQPSKNLLFSPISISGALSHLLLGARGETRKTLEEALSLPHNFSCVHSQMSKLKARLQDSLRIASQIYHHPDIKLSESFGNQSVQFYDAEPVKMSNSSEDNKNAINRWVAKQTNNKIKNLVDSVPLDTQLLVLNAVYFNGQWKVKFDNKQRKAPFVTLDNEIVKVPVLYSSKYMLNVQYVTAVKAQVAMFPLSGDTSLFILLPPTGKLSDLQLVEGKMTDVAVRQMVDQMRNSEPVSTEVTLPKITLDVQTQINPLLRKLGLSSLFEGANLCGLYPDKPLALTDARHQAFLALTEAGVEAGAATSLSYSRSYSTFEALRPFLLVLWSDRTNQPLFLGRVTNPPGETS